MVGGVFRVESGQAFKVGTIEGFHPGAHKLTRSHVLRAFVWQALHPTDSAMTIAPVSSRIGRNAGRLYATLAGASAERTI